MSQIHGWLCGPRIYAYAGWDFEFGYSGPWPLKKDGDLRKRMGRKFLKDIEPWLDMPDKKREKYRVGGGCRRF